MGGVVQQNKVYSVKSIAVATNGYTSDEGEWSPFQIFTFPKPSVSVLKTSSTTFDVTVAPVVVTPGVSFPSPTVWTYYRLNMTIGGVSTLINCTAVVVSGIPQPTVCPVTVAAGALPNFVATCYTGNPSSPKNTDLYSYNSDDTPAPGPPTIVSTGSTTADSGTLCIAAPTSGGTYSGFNCTICRLGSCNQAPTCPNSRRRSLLEAGCTGAAECQLTGLESSTEYNITCIAINSVGVASPTSSEQLLTVMQADAPAVAAKASNPLVAQCTAPSGGPWASCQLLICPPLARRRLLAASCFNATCPFNATTGIAECDLIGQVAQLKSYAINSTAVKADGVRSSQTGVQPQFYVGLYPKPVVTNALAINQTYFTMTITPDTSNPYVSYPPGGWTHWYLNATTTYPSTALYWCSANVSNGVPQPTSCQFTVPFGAGGMTKFVVWGFQGSDPSAALATDLITASVKLFYPQDGPNITSLTATSYNSSQACMAPPLRGTFSAYNCTACTGGTCLPTVSCGGSQGTCDAGKIQCLLDGMAQDTEYSVSCLAWSGSSVSPNSNTVTVTTDKAPPPPVAADPTNPLVAQCTEPPGGPWSTCSLQICPAGGRRRLLGGTISCFSTTCPFNSGIANCDLIGQVAQDTNFAISSTAIKADGVKTSQTGPQPTFNVPYYPKPIVTDAQMLGDMDFRMTIYPETGSPYVSYPPGGWTHYIVYCDFNAAISSGYCTANVSSGVPQVTDCSIYCNSGGGAFTMLSVVGYRGDPTATTLTDLRTFASDPFLSQDPPYIISTPSISTTSGTACVMQPYNNAPFSSFNCTACSGGTCEAPVSCNAARRRSLLSAGRSLLSTGCGTDETACAMNNLQPSTNYNVTCVGIKTGLITPASAVASFTTQTSG